MNSPSARLTPLSVARMQLLTAIELLVADKDPVSVQSLAGNAREILESLCRHEGINPMTELLVADHPGKPKRDIYAAMNLYRNCFKHLGGSQQERDDDLATLAQFNDTKNDYLLYICIEDYIRLTRKSTPSMQIFHSWFCACHAHLIPDTDRAQRYLALFPGIQDLDRDQRKRGLAACIETYANHPDVLGHPDTEPA